MTSSDRPVGQRFSHVYLRNDDLLQDSQSARRRVALLLDKIRDQGGLDNFLAAELGVSLKRLGSNTYWVGTFQEFESRDFLDSITLIYGFLTEAKKRPMFNPNANDFFITECSRIFSEEGLRYEFDADGGIHFKVDSEFSASSRASIAALGLPRYANARAEFEKAMNALSKSRVDGKEGIRGVFNAVECVYKLMTPKAAKLTSADAIKILQAEVQKIYGANPTALRAANKAINAFGDWVDACHNYRHEEGAEEPSQPPIDLAVSLISMGSAQLRWLISLDQASKNPPA